MEANDPFGLRGARILLTGATGSIGTVIAKKMVELGAKLYASGSDPAKLDKLAEDLDGQCTTLVCDLRSSRSIESMFSAIDELEVLICNAGVTNDMLAIKMTEDDFQRVIDINLKANFLLNREAMKKMISKRYGRIINVSSVVGLSGSPGQANYSASKAGLIGMTKSLALEVAKRGITINAVAPGFIVSNMTDVLSEQRKAAIMERIPMQRFGRGEDIVGAVVFLASCMSSYVTGQTIHVNGGMLMV